MKDYKLTADEMIKVAQMHDKETSKMFRRSYHHIIKKIEKKIVKAANNGKYECKYFLKDKTFIFRNVNDHQYYLNKIKKYFNKRKFRIDIEKTNKYICEDLGGEPIIEHGKTIHVSWRMKNPIDISTTNTILKLMMDALNDNKTSITIPNIPINKDSTIFATKYDIEDIIKHSFPNLLIANIKFHKDLYNDKLSTWNIEWRINKEEQKQMLEKQEQLKKNIEKGIQTAMNDNKTCIEFVLSSLYMNMESIIHSAFKQYESQYRITEIHSQINRTYFGAIYGSTWHIAWEKIDNVE